MIEIVEAPEPQDPCLALLAVSEATTGSDIYRVLRDIGISGFTWQEWHPDVVRTWDSLPAGFIEHYYGTDADDHCAMAWAIRQHWATFTVNEARSVLGQSEDARNVERLWKSFGFVDGIVIPTGRASRRSATIMPTSSDAGQILSKYGDVLIAAADRLDGVLRDSRAPVSISRQHVRLSPAQRAALQVQIDHPELSFDDQASLLGISSRMLTKRHQQIAGRFGVSSFSGAVVRAMQQGYDRSPIG